MHLLVPLVAELPAHKGEPQVVAIVTQDGTSEDSCCGSRRRSSATTSTPRWAFSSSIGGVHGPRRRVIEQHTHEGRAGKRRVGRLGSRQRGARPGGLWQITVVSAPSCLSAWVA